MKVLIVFALVAVFQGCQSTDSYDQTILQVSVTDFLKSFELVSEKLETLIDCMENDALEVIDEMLGEATPNACVIALRHELMEVSTIVSRKASKCIHLGVEAAKVDLKHLLDSLQVQFNGLLSVVVGLVGDLLLCLVSVLTSALYIKSVPAKVMHVIIEILASFQSLLDCELVCSNAAVKDASRRIADILVKVVACLV